MESSNCGNKLIYGINRNRGFVGVIFLAIALVAVVVGAIAAMNRNNSSGTASESAKATASIILKQGADLKIGMDLMSAGEGINPPAITFDNSPGTGLFNATMKYAHLPLPPQSGNTPGWPMFGSSSYVFKSNVYLPGIGSAAGAETVVSLGYLSKETCEAILKILYNDIVIPTSSEGENAWLSDGPLPIDDNSFGADVHYNGRPEGCLNPTSSTTGYVYYKALIEL